MSLAKQQRVDSSTLQMFVLDVLRHDDIESISSILSLMNDEGCIGWREFWPREFTEADVVAALREAIANGWVEALRETAETAKTGALAVVPAEELDQDRADLWFHLTAKGRRQWDTWDPPVSDAPTNEE